MTLEISRSRNRNSLLGSEYFDQEIRGDYRGSDSRRARYENCRFIESSFAKSSYVGATFVYCSFDGCNFSQSDFSAATIYGCTFQGCDLDQCEFDSAIIGSTAISGGRAQKSSFIRATLSRVVLDTDLHGADLRFRSAEEISFGDSNLWAAAINVNCNTFLEKRYSERQIKVMLALLATTVGNDDLRKSMRELAGDYYMKMVENLTDRKRGGP
jgi:uncharacterized protein YjbI with pentapeptide repeats